ncbi:stage II sporulation protein M [Lederbergia wuyishanensis]|uniref:Membrane protein SpoIIM required for sporulation n=1 Tax=Lederbergia wuyishanensis TaxID=1347903 RepID=A0ABU0D094_9BACI|nr:stage II sporulation protein M [Lederbergia wuyishanensis]MCJ8006438.1 stage II sporulation protein M [Lederbergia wuyishanensis]MDQ0341813.1 putative membrane protein SpoIIM required for sporulation [Lederbergia wuyishanensis]
MNIKQFIKQHRDEWKQLEHLISVLQKRKNTYTAMDIEQFNRLYQKAAQNLSYCQTYFSNEDVTVYLNGLVSKSHNLLYKDQISSLKQVRHFFSTTFIGLLLGQWKAVVVAMLLFSLGALGSFFAVISDPLHLYSILPGEIAKNVDPTQLGSQDGAVDSALMSASIMTNNIQVAILAFAGGVTFGLLTVYVLIYNGIIVGALAALFWHYGKSYDFWAYIVPHGMIELTAIFIAGGAGLLMGYKLWVPGDFSRGFHLKHQAKRSVQLLLGTIPLFIIAGIIEGFITPAAISLEAKYIVAIITVFGLILYMLIGKILLNRSLSNK